MPIDLKDYLNESIDKSKFDNDDYYHPDDSLYHNEDEKSNVDLERLRGD